MDKRELALEFKWKAIVITLSIPEWRTPIENECLKLKTAGLLPKHDILLMVDDPQSLTSESLGVGSGGATLNGLLVIVEKLSAMDRHTMINPELLRTNRILMVHFGRNSHHLIGGNALLPLSSCSSWIPPSVCGPFPATLLQNSLWMASVLASETLTGVWMTSMDFFIPFSNSISIPNVKNFEGALVCSLKVSEKTLESPHGVIYSDKNDMIQDIVYEDMSMKGNKNVNIISGSTFLSSAVAIDYLSLHTFSPIDRCTYYGAESNAEPVQLSLYFDLLLPLCQSMDKDKYLSGELSQSYAKRANFSDITVQEAKRVRIHILKTLSRYQAFEHNLCVSNFYFLDPQLSHDYALRPLIENLKEDNNPYFRDSSFCSKSIVNKSAQANESIFYVNCLIEPCVQMIAQGDIVVSNFDLKSSSSLQTLNFGRNLTWQMWPLKEDEVVITCHGFLDAATLSYEDENATVFNIPWNDFFIRNNLLECDIWNSSSTHSKCLLSAKLFAYDTPVDVQLKLLEGLTNPFSNVAIDDKALSSHFKMTPRKSFLDILRTYNMTRYLEHQSNIEHRLTKRYIEKTAHETSGLSLLSFFNRESAGPFETSLSLLTMLHEVIEVSGAVNASRLFANVADLLGCMARDQGGLRSGPAANKDWLPALEALKDGNFLKGGKLLKEVCFSYTKTRRPEQFIRAARHYERASHIMISKQVETANEKVFPLFGAITGCVPMGIWVEGSSPARLDLAGGWSDTPPVCYEQGGAVLNIAIKINDRNPIGVKARIVPSLQVTCVLRDCNGSDLKLVWTELVQLKDYDNPIAPGALVKAAIIYTKFLNLDSDETLSEQLDHKYKGGLEIIVWSELAQGSGLGGSSIIAGTILGTIFVLMGHLKTTVNQLIHATLGIEQMLTTGGGWQDQVGGLVGGLKLGISDPTIPLVVQTYCLPLRQEFVDFLNSRLFLIYTGKIRLARNLLQTVLRNWYAKEKSLLKSFRDLRALAFEAAQTVLDEDGISFGRCISKYWMLKKSVASGCEPTKVAELLSHLNSTTLGNCLTGAGGGGYLYALMRDQHTDASDDKISNFLAENFAEMHKDSVLVDRDGLIITVNGATIITGTDQAQTELSVQHLKTIIHRANQVR